MIGKQFELEVLGNNKYVIAEFDKDNYYLDNENSAKSLECRLNELYEENQLLKQRLVEKDDIEWLRNNTVWTTMPTSRRTYTTTSVSDKEKEQKMFFVDMEKQRKMF